MIDEIENNDTEGLENIPLNNLVLNDATINIKNSEQTVKVDNLEGTGGTINAKQLRTMMAASPLPNSL